MTAALAPTAALSSRKAAIHAVLARQSPPKVVYGPNYWQWFAHHRNHGTLPPELAGCQTQLDLIRHLGLEVFSRNIYCDQQRCWFGGLCDEVYQSGVEVSQSQSMQGKDHVYLRRLQTRFGTLEEQQR